MVATTLIDTALYIVLGFLLFALISIVIYIFISIGNYKHTFVRKIITGGRPIILVDKAKEYIDKKTGVIYWRLLKAKHIISRPPSKALHTTAKGNFIVEAYYFGDINYKYSVHELNKDTLAQIEKMRADYKKDLETNVKDIVRTKLLDLNSKKIFSLMFFKPTPSYIYSSVDKNIIELDVKEGITTNQRLLVHDQVKKAVERKHKGIGQYLPIIAGLAALIMLVAVVFIFGGDLIKPMVELNNKNALVTDKIAQIAQSLDNTARLLTGKLNDAQFIGGNNYIPLANKTAPS